VSVKKLKLRRPDLCVKCGDALAAGTPAWWDSSARTVTCARCCDCSSSAPLPVSEPLAELECGQPGASLVREYERRKRNREQRTRAAHPYLGGLLLALQGAPQNELAFSQGAAGERAVAEALEQRTAARGVITLNNRRMPGGRGDIDHIAISPSGVYIVDTKNVKGKVEIRAPLFSSPKLLIGGRDRTHYIDGLDRQTAAVRAALDGQGRHEIRIQAALCFTKADLPLLMTQKFRGHLLLYRRALAKRLNAKGPLSPTTIEEIARCLATALPPVG
jgi:hypothetical protein